MDGSVVVEEEAHGWYVDHPFGHDGPLPENMARSRAAAYALKYTMPVELNRLPPSHPARGFQTTILASDGGTGGEF